MMRNRIDDDYKFSVFIDDDGGYEVCLPHQCGAFKVLGFELDRDDEPNAPYVGDYPARPTDHDFAVRQMELFVQRAQEALERLKKKEWTVGGE